MTPLILLNVTNIKQIRNYLSDIGSHILIIIIHSEYIMTKRQDEHSQFVFHYLDVWSGDTATVMSVLDGEEVVSMMID